MKNPSLDNLYAEIDKHILLVQSYTEIEQLAFILKACRLKPHSFIFGDRDNKLILHRWWIDEFGNSLKIEKKRVRLSYNDLSLERHRIICTDLYHGLLLDKVAKISKLAHVIAGKDEDLLQDSFFLTFLGIDNYLRSYMYLQDEWQQVSPLLLGLKNLKRIGENQDIKYFTELQNKEIVIPCFSKQEWLTFLPANASFLALIERHQEALSLIFK